MPDYADLEIGLHRRDVTSYAVDLRFIKVAAQETTCFSGWRKCRHPPFSWLSRLNECARLLYKALSARRANSIAPVQANIAGSGEQSVAR